MDKKYKFLFIIFAFLYFFIRFSFFYKDNPFEKIHFDNYASIFGIFFTKNLAMNNDESFKNFILMKFKKAKEAEK